MKIDISNLNKAFESKIRLGIMAALIPNPDMSFNQLKELLNVTDGNLASHLKALEKNEFIIVEKSFVGRKPNTTYRVTTEGQRAFKEHINALEQIIKGQMT